MLTATLLAASSAGLLGGVHCAAMCGPLAVAGCARRRDAVGYFFTRWFGYTFVGAVMGAAGHELMHAVPTAWVQQGALLIVALAAAWRGVSLLRPRDVVQLPRRRRRRVTAFFARLIPRRGAGLGLATAILPCGVLMAGWMLAASTARPLDGAAVMAVYALATAPGLIAPVLFGRWIDKLQLSRVHYGIAWCALAVWLGAWPLLGGLMGGHH